jgi:hypothetical protein
MGVDRGCGRSSGRMAAMTIAAGRLADDYSLCRTRHAADQSPTTPTPVKVKGA